jgi:Domain of unknown function (DUF4136)
MPITLAGDFRMNARHVAAALLILCSTGCGYSIKYSTSAADYDPAIDFSKYSTFFVLEGDPSGSEEADQPLVAAVETALTEKGWLEVPEGESQAVVVVNRATSARHTYESFYDGWGGWDWQPAAPARSRPFVEDYEAGTVVVTIFDAETKRAIWRNYAVDVQSASPSQNAKATDASVARLFKDLPSGSLGAAGSKSAPQADEPPRVFFSTSPARLILVDGDPVYRPVPGTELQRIVNTKPLIVRDVAGMYYLKILDGWMEAYSLYANWSVSGVGPDGAGLVLQQARATSAVDLLDRADPGNPAGTRSLATGPAPAIFLSTTPAELIVTNGPMVFGGIEGTALEYVVNTSADLFKEPTDRELYLLISGRWLRSWTIEGPWQPVARRDLPADFARIPDGSPKAKVKLAMRGPK